MKFVKADGKIKCVRTSADCGDAHEEVVVTEFDDAIDEVAPHVAALLHGKEINELQAWLKDHASLKTKLAKEPLEKTILETMPAMLSEASSALEELDALDADLYQSIRQNLDNFERKLALFNPLVKETSPDLNEIEDNEILKNQLAKIKRAL